jgi:molybdenum cofactor biosynthesis enzyme MoaA
MKLEDIGFYTLSNARAKSISANSPMWRCEIIITDKCNFSCPYCRGMRNDCQGTLSLDEVKKTIDFWAQDNLQNIRFSGGEPTTHPKLLDMIKYAKSKGVKRIAISTNGSSTLSYYNKLIDAGANDFSISLDACCSSTCDTMSGTCGFFSTIINNIREISARTYVTVGVVITEENHSNLINTVCLAHDLGVADIRIISAAQYNKLLSSVTKIPQRILDAHPILRYRVDNIKTNRNVRGLEKSDASRCHLIQDDSAVAGEYHFPCIIYLREQGEPIGKVGSNMRKERISWFERHDTHEDPICKKNCLDVCIDFNNQCEKLKQPTDHLRCADVASKTYE